MSRSLFAILNQKYGRPIDPVTRRTFVKGMMAATGGLLLSNQASANFKTMQQGKKIVVIGAGFSGLAVAHELASVGYDVTIIEARERLGGRVYSFNDTIRPDTKKADTWVAGKNAEGGGELIGSNHPCWVHYAEKFGLEFLDMGDESAEAPIVLDGKRLTPEESEKLWETMEGVLQRMTADSVTVNSLEPWKTENAAALDKKTCADFINAQPDLDAFTKGACDVLLSSDNAVEIAMQSYLGMLTCIAGAGGERYFTESEVYRCKGGNQQLAFKLAEAIGMKKITLNLAVSEITIKGNKVMVTCRDGRTIEADDVIVTVPPSVWHKIKFNPGLPATLKPQTGVALKYLAEMKKKFWRDSELSQYMLSDDFLSQTWDGTDAQEEGEGASFHCFSGGQAAVDAMKIKKTERDAKYGAFISSVYPSFKDNFVRSRFMDWPNDPWTMQGYSFPAPGEVTTIGPALWNGIGGKIHFAGEHCSYQFVGYMEGGLNSGVQLARRLAARDGLSVPEIMMPPAPVEPEEPAPEEVPAEAPTTNPVEVPAA
ncbi:MAG TPA: FAD-dependent oxidoreductase [Tepidisphaeraceae bacterium]|nr:FAD-dependent oxidoreductase [Tepidisphaeraceae bacterium]